MQHKWVSWSCSYIALAASVVASVVAAEPQRPGASTDKSVRVLLRDGRQWNAVIDHRTNDELLWMRFTRGNAHLSTAVSWDLVESVQAGETRHSGAEFRELASQFATRLPGNNGPGGPEVPATRNDLPVWNDVPVWQANLPGRGSVGAPQSLTIEAQVANWDRDAELDGIEIRVMPRSAAGVTIPVDGTLLVELVGRNQLSTTDRRSFPELGRWSQPVRSADFATGWGAVYRVPFRGGTPDQDLTLQSWGWVRVSLQGKGIPVLDAQAPVRLRTFNPVRDQWLDQQRNHDSFGRYQGRHW